MLNRQAIAYAIYIKERNLIMNRKITIFIFLALIGIILLGASKPEAASPQIKWEYKIVSPAELLGIESVGDAFEKAFGEKGVFTAEGAKAINQTETNNMNLLGAQGWELVCYDKDTGFIFKRIK